MVGVYSPTLSPWLAWTSYGLQFWRRQLCQRINGRGAGRSTGSTHQRVLAGKEAILHLSNTTCLSPSITRDATQWSSKSRKFAPFFAHFVLVPRKPMLAQRETSPEPAKGGKGYNQSDWLKMKLYVVSS